MIAFGFFETDLDALRSDERVREQQRSRFERMAPHVESTGTDGLHEVVEEVSPS